MKPRYKPSYSPNGKEEFLGRAGELDVWTELVIGDGTRIVILVGPRERRDRGADHNFDVYPIDGNVLSQRYLDEDGRDIHVELHEMCQVYELCVKHGYITVLEKVDGI